MNTDPTVPQAIALTNRYLVPYILPKMSGKLFTFERAACYDNRGFFVNGTGFEPTTPTTTNLKILRIKAETNCLSWRIFVPESDLNPFARSRLNPVSAGIN